MRWPSPSARACAARKDHVSDFNNLGPTERRRKSIARKAARKCLELLWVCETRRNAIFFTDRLQGHHGNRIPGMPPRRNTTFSKDRLHGYGYERARRHVRRCDQGDPVRESEAMTQVLSVDPGPRLSGYAILRSDRQRVLYEGGGTCSSDFESLKRLVQLVAPDAILAVEVPGQIHPNAARTGPGFLYARGKQLLATRAVASEILTIGKMLGRRVLQLSAQQWRRALCGRGVVGVPNDKHVKAALRLLVPSMPARSNNHLRDAIGIGWVALQNESLITRTA
jgi:Holliday junction resolvasome RuvABC endonuclease subunit